MALPARPGRQGAVPPCRDSLPGTLRRLTHQPSAGRVPIFPVRLPAEQGVK